MRETAVAHRDPIAWHLLSIAVVSIAYEWLFLHHGIAWLFDEGWPLYAAMRLHEGGSLYVDTFFCFPPGHLFPAWLAYALDPPGIVLARAFYAAFDVALCLSLYGLGRRLTTPSFALLAALLLAVAAPRSHLAHLLFGYRYLVFSVLALLAYAVRLERDDRRFMAVAGLLAGVALVFRLTPAFAVTCGIGLACLASHRDPREAVRDGLAYGAGMALPVLPVLAWMALGPGLEVAWREIVTRIVALQSAQSLPTPPFSWLPPEWERRSLYRWFVSLQYRAYIAMYALYFVALVARWVQARRAGRAFRDGLLLAVVVWGGVYLLRTLGRSDDHHLMSALPPACLLIAHAAQGALAALLPEGAPARRWAVPALALAILLPWSVLGLSDRALDPEWRGTHALKATGNRIAVRSPMVARKVDGVVARIERYTRPGDVVFDLTGAPLFHVLAGRLGPGGIDVIIPGIFLTETEERELLERLRADPPALVLWPVNAFDDMPERSIEHTAPALARWVRGRYVPIERWVGVELLRPRERGGRR